MQIIESYNKPYDLEQQTIKVKFRVDKEEQLCVHKENCWVTFKRNPAFLSFSFLVFGVFLNHWAIFNCNTGVKGQDFILLFGGGGEFWLTYAEVAIHITKAILAKFKNR